MKDNEFYCVFEKKAVVPDPETITKDHRMKSGKIADKGICPSCGKTVYKIKKFGAA